MRYLTAEQNARADGREYAIERSGPKSEEIFDRWRAIFRANVVRVNKRGNEYGVIHPEASHDEFLQLIAEWDQGFDEAVRLILAAPAERAAEVRRIAERVVAPADLLEQANMERLAPAFAPVTTLPATTSVISAYCAEVRNEPER